MNAYYNEIDPEKAAWIRELMKAGVVAPGDVDERDIKLVQPDDLRGYRQCHFFAGIAVWSYALRLAGWADDREVWTGSCPCQPFSAAGKREGYNDERHVWPEWYRLISACRPAVVFGEQVSSAINGTAIENANVQALQGRETIFRVLRELQRQSPISLQGMFAGPRERLQTGEARRGKRTLSGVAREEEGICAGKRGAVPGKEEGTAMHPRPRGHSGENRPWILRDHGDSVRSYQASLMELTISGQDRPDEGIHPGERESDSLFLECDGERLGHPQGSGSGKCDTRAAFKAKRRIDRIFDRCFEGESSWSWLDLISADLEATGYSRRSAVLGAHSLGAPHRRQRLYFCADTEHSGHNRPHGAEAVTNSDQPEVRIPDGDCASGECPNTTGTRREEAREHGSGLPLLSARPEQRSGTGQRSEPNGTGSLTRREASTSLGHRNTADSASGVIDLRDTTQRGLTMHGSASGNAGHAALTDEAGNIGNASTPRLSHSEPEDLPGTRRQDKGRAITEPSETSSERIWRGPGWLDPNAARSASTSGATRGFWADCDWWYGRDGKYRPIGSGISPLVSGTAQCGLLKVASGTSADIRLVRALGETEPESGEARVLRLRGYGDAINSEVAAAFIRAYMESR